MFKGGGAGPPHRVMNYMLSAVSWYKGQEFMQCRSG
jgi:hypothetical protein